MKALKAVKRDGRGQASVEYLVLLAIAIIIAVVAVGVLAGFIKIGTATTYKKKGGVYWKSADIGIMDWEIYTTTASQNSTLILQNNKEYQIEMHWLSTDGGSTTYAISKQLLPGDTYTWQGPMPFNCTADGGYSYTVTFQFDNMEHGLNNKRFTGVEKMAGDCSTKS
jgi:uncharacterized protein (UPF0333 family)